MRTSSHRRVAPDVGSGLRPAARPRLERRDVQDMLVFFFSSRRRHTRFDCDWSSDVCSSDLLTGQTLEAWLYGVSHAPLLSVGINCALGPQELRPHIEALAGLAPFYVSCYPNADRKSVV